MSKIILAKNGNIKIQAKNGDIELEAANIHLKASEEIKFSTPDKINFESSVMSIKATNVNVLARHQLTMADSLLI